MKAFVLLAWRYLAQCNSILILRSVIGLLFGLTAATYSGLGVASATEYKLESNQWNQLVVPGNSANYSVEILFGKQLPADQYGNTWNIYLWNNVTGQYYSPGLSDTIPVGQGFWIIQSTGEPVTLSSANIDDAPLVTSSACPSPDGCTETALFSANSTSRYAMIGSAMLSQLGTDSFTLVAPVSGSGCSDGCSHTAAVEAGLMEQSIYRYNPSTGAYETIDNITMLGPWEAAWFRGTTAITGVAANYLFQSSQNPGACSYTNPNDPSDDPNPPYNGTEGRYPVSANPIPNGFPTPLSTGICGIGISPADLTPSDGITIKQDGTVIDMQDITGNVKVQANDVVIKRSRITGSGSIYTLQLVQGYKNLTVEDTRIRTYNIPNPGMNTVLVNGPATFTRVHISGGSDNVKSNSGDLTIEDSYLTGTYREPGSHNDILQVRQGDNYVIKGNTMLAPYLQSTSAFLFQSKAGGGGGPINNVLIENNYLSGGTYTGYTRESDFPMTGVIVRNNVFEADSFKFGYKSNDSDGANWYDNSDSNGVKLD